MAQRGRDFASAALVFLRRKDTAGEARRAAAIALAIRVSNAGLAYFAQVELARLMGRFEFGVFAYTWVWFLVFAAVATMGFGDSPLRFIAQLRERHEADHLRGLLRFATFTVLVTAIVVAGLIIVALPYAAPFMGHAYVLPMGLMAVALPFACLQSLLEAVGRSYGWTVPALLPIYILRHGLLLTFMIAAVLLGFEATAVNGLICLIMAIAVSLAYQATHILLRLRRVLPPGPRAYRPREWLGGSAPFAVLYGAANLSSFADVLVLSFFVSPAEIAIYFAATRIVQVVNLIPYAATVGTAHLFSASHERGDHDELQRLCSYVAQITFAIAIVSVAAILLIGEWLLGMFGAGFEAGYVPLVILVAGVLARVIAGPAEDVLNMTGFGSLSASTYLVIVVVNVGLALALITPFGISGAAVASSISLAARALWLSLATRALLNIRTSVFASLPPVKASGPPGRWDPSELHTPAE